MNTTLNQQQVQYILSAAQKFFDTGFSYRELQKTLGYMKNELGIDVGISLKSKYTEMHAQFMTFQQMAQDQLVEEEEEETVADDTSVTEEVATEEEETHTIEETIDYATDIRERADKCLEQLEELDGRCDSLIERMEQILDDEEIDPLMGQETSTGDTLNEEENLLELEELACGKRSNPKPLHKRGKPYTARRTFDPTVVARAIRGFGVLTFITAAVTTLVQFS